MIIDLPVFLVTTLLLTMLPGAGQALMIRQTLEGGKRRARATLAGNASGVLIWAVAAAAGLSAVLLADPRAYAVVRVAGGLVLALLGIGTLRGALREPPGAEPGAGPDAGPGAGPGEAYGPGSGRRPGRWGAYAAGLGTSLGNPKAGVFAVSVLPQFVTADGPVLWSSIALGVVWAAVNAGWYLLFTWAVGRGRALISRPVVRRRLSIATGVTLLLLGAGVAAGI
ncbi:LysE family translocator [Streptomyces sp. NPDC093085]|uniref:LysE family translocator n=1 Tax=Streptomyces sp. NPDC093085 TaxID=3155068 RepID=UPI0034213E5D